MPSVRPYETRSGRRYLVRWREGREARSKGGFERRRDADRFAAETGRRLALGILYEAPPEALGEFLDGWLDRYKLQVRESTWQRRVEALRVLSPRLRATPLPALRAADVEDDIVVVGRRAPRQAQLALASVKLALRSAAERGQRFDQAILTLKPPRSREREARFLAWPEVEHLASFLPDSEARLVMVAALTGLRQGELFSLTWADVNLDAATVSVTEGKTAAARRSVDLAPAAVELLAEQRDAMNQPSTHLVFASPTGARWRPENFMHRLFRPAVQAAGLVGFTFHDLRHSFASLLVAANVHPKLAATLMGHSDGGALFLKRYSHLYAGAGREAAAALELVVRAPNPITPPRHTP